MKLSIITINYNNAKELEQTIKSIVAQDITDCEYIVIDGNSTDGSVDIIKKYSEKIDCWISEPDSGVYNAMNKGIKVAKGEYLFFLNSGDVINKDADFQFVLKELDGQDIIYFDIQVEDIENKISCIKKTPKLLDFKFFIHDTIPHQAAFIKRGPLTDYGGYNENIKISADWAYFIDAVCLHKSSFKHVDYCFSTFFLGGISSTKDSLTKILHEREKYLAEKYSSFYSFYQDWRSLNSELFRIKMSRTVTYAKKIGLLKWLKP